MKKIFSYCFFLLLLACAHAATAQSGNILTQTFDWHSTSGYDVVASDSTHAAMKFTTVHTTSIEHRNHSNVLQTFTITSTEGTWSNISSAGSMIYHVMHNGQAGVITITRTGSGVTFTIDFTAQGVKVVFIIHQIG